MTRPLAREDERGEFERRRAIHARAVKAARQRMAELGLVPRREVAAAEAEAVALPERLAHAVAKRFATSPREIMREVAASHGVSLRTLMENDRRPELVKIRHEICWRLRLQGRLGNGRPPSLPEIGRLLGDRDHSSVLFGIRAHQRRIDAGEADG